MFMLVSLFAQFTQIFKLISSRTWTNKVTQRDNNNRITITEKKNFKKYYFDILYEFQKILEIKFGDPTIQTKLTTEHN